MSIKKEEKEKRGPRPPADTLEGRENQLISLAVNLAEKQMLDGTASAQVISHYLKLGSTRESLEQERLRGENQLALAKIKAIGSGEEREKLYREALDAMRRYSGQEPMEYSEDDD